MPPFFAEDSSDFENLDINALIAKIEETSKTLKAFTEQFNNHQTESTQIANKMAPLMNELRDLNAKKIKHDDAMKRIKPEITAQKQNLESLQHWLRQARLKWLTAQEFEQKAAKFDELTSSAIWREFAMEHQIKGAKEIAVVGGRALLGDKRGLGKSLTSLIVCDMIQSKKIIVFGPKETIKNFENEIKLWAPKRTLISLIGKNKLHRDMALDILKNSSQWIVTVNLEAWRRDKETVRQLMAIQADTVIIDEAHFIKDPDSVMCEGVTKVVYAANICMLCGKNNLVNNGNGQYECNTDGCIGVYNLDDKDCRSVKHVIPMTGTPILNNPKELFPLVHLIDRESFPTEASFLMHYCQKYDGKWRFKYGGEAALRKKLSHQFIARDRNSTDVKIPPQKIQYHDIEFDRKKYPKQYRAYQELKDKYIIFSNENPEIQLAMPNAITAITRMRQMMTWPNGIKWTHPVTKEILFQCDVTESIKIDYAAELIAELVYEGERVVLFSQFKPPLNELYRRLEKILVETTDGQRYIRPVCLHGDTPDGLRERIRDDFDRRNKSHEWDVVLGHYKVGGQSLNFTAATQMIILDREWNDGREDQARGRIDRIGQTEETTVHVIRVEKSIDDWMDELIQFKKKIVEGFEDAHVNFGAALKKAIEDGDI